MQNLIRAIPFAALATLLLLSAPVPAEELKLYPVDEAAEDPAFLAFRDDLLAAIRRRDLKAVAAVASVLDEDSELATNAILI